MKFSRGAIALYVGLIFVSGGVLGAFGQRLYNASIDVKKPAPRNPEEMRRKVVAMYQQRLKLTDEQLAQLNTIMDETRQRVEEARRSLRPTYHKIHEEQDQKIRSILTPEQQVELDKIHKEREQRQNQKQSGRGAHNPGPRPPAAD